MRTNSERALMMIRFCSTMLALALVLPTLGQKVTLTPQEFQQHKAAGTLPPSFDVLTSSDRTPIKPDVKPAGQPKGGGGGFNICDCWIEPDASYTTQTNWPLGSANFDDGSDGPFSLPFTFNLYGDLYNAFYLNINGNISFVFDYFTFTPDGFPNANFIMVAPFWADVELTNDPVGTIQWKVTPTALYVNWTDVGYYSQHYDKRNTFQLIITDGTDPVLGVGKNVSFCYKDMQWTTGDASGGSNGFGGSPAVVGCNRGNGVDYIQFGTFDHDALDYDGPFGIPDGVSWLDNKNFVFTTAVSTNNIPPIASGALLCDTLVVCTGELVNVEMSFIAPESGQVTNATSSAPSLSTYTELSNTSGALTAVITSEFQPTVSEVGFHNIHYEAIDNGVPPLTTIIDIVVQVVLAPSGPPVITGDTAACEGATVTLTASSGFDDYYWSNGATTQTVQVGAGTYTVMGGAGNCALTSDPFTVIENPSPDPVITGVLATCGGLPTELGTSTPYDSYTWSNGATSPTITVGSGTYSVVVTDANGCTGGSASVNVIVGNDPTAGFGMDPVPVVPGEDLTFTDASNGNGSTITGWSWELTYGGNVVATGTGTEFITVLNTPGPYTMCLTVTTAEGCTDVLCQDFAMGVLEIFIPNVFSPNGDGNNDYLEFTNIEFYPNSDLKVYSRWGNVVYESASYRNQWNARDVSEGTYFYILKLSDGREYNGHVTLLR